MHDKSIKLLIFLVIFIYHSATGQKPSFLNDYNKIWVDSVFNSLTLDEKIGQLLMPRGNFSGRPHDMVVLEKWVKEYKIGGIVLFASSPFIQATITNRLQSLSKIPMLIGQDLEWGTGMRLDSTDRFPYAITLGAMQGNDFLIEAMGKEIGKQCKRLGVHINFAPVVDVNINPKNPVINFRSFGADKEAVADKGLAYMEGLQSQRVLATAKHFPGHGDTDVDSHFDLPVIRHDKQRLMDIEIYPFKQLIDHGLSGIMTAHLTIPALDSTPNLASTFSPKIIFELLREELNFEGLIFTDAMEMEGAVKNYPPGEAMVRALLAGNDILETFSDVPVAVMAIKEAVLNGRIPMEVLDFKVRKILKAKSWVGLDKYIPTDLNNLTEDLNTIESDLLNFYFAEKSTTCLKNNQNLLPIRDLTKKIAVVSLESPVVSDFAKMVSHYVSADYYHIPKNASDSLVQSITERTKSYDIVLTGIHLIDIRAGNKYGLTVGNIRHIQKLISMDNAVVCLFGNPLILGKIPEFAKTNALMLGYQMTSYTESIMAQTIFGALSCNGTLPLTINDEFRMGMGIPLSTRDRLSYGPPEMVGMDRVVLNTRIDSIVQSGQRENAYPGCVVLVAKDNKVIFNKAYGYHRYEDVNSQDITTNPEGNSFTFIDDAMDNPATSISTLEKKVNDKADLVGKVKTDDLYDLASLTKITSSTLAVMQLVSEGVFDLDATLGEYYPYFKKSNKAHLTFRDMLTHRSGLKAWIPFWKDAVDTVETIKKAVLIHPELEKRCIITMKKPGFFKRLFGKKPTKTIEYLPSLKADSLLWGDMLTCNTITWKKNTFSKTRESKFTVQIAEQLWLHKDYYKNMLKQIADSPLNIPAMQNASGKKYNYVYSDLHFYLYPEIIKRLTGRSWVTYLDDTYKKLGANSLGFNPVISLDRIVPTEYDSLFRQNLIHGRVHDEGAAMMGGISGHAGLFGNANDLTKLMQMFLNKGSYGGYRFIDSSVVNEFTSYQFPFEKNRRGIGFDKKDFNPKVLNAPDFASSLSYGHSGYTGTYTWVDPKYNLVYVFLSNRVYPSRENIKISSLNIRIEIGNQIIKTILENSQGSTY
ncbi:MAG: serine hydrolase [Saprospiraceae bacterium]|nr:serine hydrolase [Saprospiraceae bacterium]